MATSLNNLAGLYHSQEKYAEAEPLYLRSLQINEQQLGPLHPDTATSLNNLALLYSQQGKSSENTPDQRGGEGKKAQGKKGCMRKHDPVNEGSRSLLRGGS